MDAPRPARRGWHNLGTVIAFEVRRTLKRRSFWALTLAVPLLMAGIGALVLFSNSEAIRADSSRPTTFTYADASGLVSPTVAARAGGTLATDPAAARQAVIDGRADLFIAYPSDPRTQPIDITGRSRGLTGGDYGTVARQVLVDSAKATVSDARVAAVIAGQASVHQVDYRDGKPAPGWASTILPGLFLVVFYLAIVMLGNQMLNITVEEKENRVTEMILTTIKPTALIVGKLLALVVVGFVQAIVLIGPLAALPSFFASMLPRAPIGAVPDPGSSVSVSFPPDGAGLVNPPVIALGAALCLGSFLLFTGILVSIGAVMPTAKDAGAAFGTIVVALFIPFYAFGVLLGDPHGLASQILTFFPLTAPVTSMLRNALGTLDPAEAAIVLVLIYGSAAALLALGVRLFRTGSISYGVRLDVRKVLFGRRPAAPASSQFSPPGR